MTTMVDCKPKRLEFGCYICAKPLFETFKYVILRNQRNVDRLYQLTILSEPIYIFYVMGRPYFSLLFLTKCFAR